MTAPPTRAVDERQGEHVATAPVPPILEELRGEIDAALTILLDRLLPRLTDTHPSLAPVVDELRVFSADGKRIRPALLLLGYQVAGGTPRSRVHGPALALELLHTCALVHDDVIDRAVTRRGRPSVHRSFGDRHRTAGWRGESGAYGEAVAILVGDLAFVHADEAFLDARVPDASLLAGFRRFTRLREEVMVGQYLDLQSAAEATTDRQLAMTVATLKSGRYSVSRPLEIGALLAGADEATASALGAVGEPLGRAFQVRDDLLGVFGDEARTGKSATSDLAEGKRTLLVVEALTRLDGAQAAELEAALGDPGLDAAAASRLRGLMEDCGARRATEQFVADSIAQARRRLDELDLAPQAHRHLAALADYLGNRSE